MRHIENIMSDECSVGITYLPKHARKLLGLGAEGQIHNRQFDEVIFATVVPIELANWLEIMPKKRVRIRCLRQRDRLMPTYMLEDMWQVHRFLSAHGPSAIVAVAMGNAIINMRRMGIRDTRQYCDLVARLDSNPPESFTDFVRIISDMESEVIKCEQPLHA